MTESAPGQEHSLEIARRRACSITSGKQQIALLDTVLLLAVDQALRTAEPSGRAGPISPRIARVVPIQNAQRAARRPVAGVQAHLVGALQERSGSRPSRPTMEADDREQLEVRPAPSGDASSARDRDVVGVQPRPLRIGLTAAVQFVPAHLPAILPLVLRIGRGACRVPCRR